MDKTLHIYSRISSDAQEEGESLEAQQSAGIKKAQSLGMDYKIWNEGAASSAKENLLNRPVLRECLDAVESGEVKHLYVWNTDRLARNTEAYAFIQYSFLMKHQVILYTPGQTFDFSDTMSRMVFSILGAIAQYDNELRTIRLSEGLIRAVQREGRWIGGAPPFGYKLDEKKLVVDEDEAKWVIKIHEMYRDNHTIDEIRDELMTNGVMTRRGNAVWSHGSINKLLTNTHYDGYWYFRPKNLDSEIRVECPRICEPQLISAVQESKEKRSYKQGSGSRTKTSNQKHDYLLSNLLVCGDCGSPFYSNRKINQQSSYYYCSQKTNKFRDKHTDRLKKCSSQRNLNLDATDQEVWQIVKDVIGSSNLYREEIKNEVFQEEGTYTQRAATKKKKIRDLEKLEREVEKIRNTIVDLTTQDLLADTKSKQQVIKNLEKKRTQDLATIEELKSELSDHDTRSAWVDWLGKFYQQMDDLDSLPTKIKNEFLVGLVNEIKVKEIDLQKHQLEIHFKFPYVGDKLEWREYDETGKRIRKSGYTLMEGKRVKKSTVQLSKKS